MQSDISKENITVIQKEIWKERNLEEVRNTDRKMERSKEKKGEKEIKKDRLRDKERERKILDGISSALFVCLLLTNVKSKNLGTTLVLVSWGIKKTNNLI